MLRKLVGLSLFGVVVVGAAHADLTPRDASLDDGLRQAVPDLTDGYGGDGARGTPAAGVADGLSAYIHGVRGVRFATPMVGHFSSTEGSSLAGLFGFSTQKVLLGEFDRPRWAREWADFGSGSVGDRLSRFGPPIGGDEWEAPGSGQWSAPQASDDVSWESEIVSPIPAPAAAVLGAIGIGLVARVKRRLQ